MSLWPILCSHGPYIYGPCTYGLYLSHAPLACRQRETAQPQVRAQPLAATARWSSTRQLRHRQQVSPGTCQTASRRVQAHGRELRPSRVARDSVVNYNDNASSGGIGARYVVTGYSKSKRSRWGLAPAEQLSVRQPTVTETRCGRLNGLIKG